MPDRIVTSDPVSAYRAGINEAHEQAGIAGGGTVRRGKSIIAAEETRAVGSFGLMPTPDRVQNIVLPTDGLIFVSFFACMSGQPTGAAAIFIGANQLKIQDDTSTAPVVQQAILVGTSYAPITSDRVGLVVGDTSIGVPVTTGQAVALRATAAGSPGVYDAGGPCAIFAAAGTYDVSVQFLNAKVKERRLWVWTMGF